VRIELAAPEPGVTEPSEKEQFKVRGQPAADNEMGLLNDPNCALAVIRKVFDCPGRIVIEAGDALKERVGTFVPELQVEL
jgi:hypothetical protein